MRERREVMIVGAGLSGLVAAIHCARAGHRVRVLEQYQEIGGIPYIHPSVDATPIEPDKLSDFLEIPLGPPQIAPYQAFNVYFYGKLFPFDAARFYLHGVERGSRDTSLDTYLYRIAKEEGVEFDFGWKLRSQEDAARLPPGTIFATGLSVEVFEALNLPYQQIWGYVGHGELQGPPQVAVWFDTYTSYYNYLASINGVVFALFFDKVPVRKEHLERWKSQMKQDTGINITQWREHHGVVATKSISNPRLFHGERILAGTLAGMQDPLFLFGVHSSLVSGKIAGIAVDDKARAYELFKKMISTYKLFWVQKRSLDSQPHWFKKLAFRTASKPLLAKPELFQGLVNFGLTTVPGFRRV